MIQRLVRDALKNDSNFHCVRHIVSVSKGCRELGVQLASQLIGQRGFDPKTLPNALAGSPQLQKKSIHEDLPIRIHFRTLQLFPHLLLKPLDTPL